MTQTSPHITAILHPRTRQQLELIALRPDRSYIFHGARSLGKNLAAAEITAALNPTHQPFHPDSHPHYVIVRPEDKPSITIEQIRQLNRTLTLSPYFSEGQRIVVIDDAHQLTTEAQNALLKLIEEPPARTSFILIAQDPASLLDTVRSRCAEIHFLPTPPKTLAPALSSLVPEATPVAVLAAATLGEGRPGAALRLVSDPAAAFTFQQTIDQIKSLSAKSRFERLRTTTAMTTAKIDHQLIANVLHHEVVSQIRDNAIVPQEGARRLTLLERYRTHLAAKVAAKVALEALMLEY